MLGLLRFIHRWIAVLLAFQLLAVSSAMAHRAGEGYIYLDVTDETISGRFEMRVEDLLKTVGANADADEFENVFPQIAERLGQSLSIEINGKSFPARIKTFEVFLTRPGLYTKIVFETDYRGPIPDVVTIDHRSIFTEALPGQPVLVLLASNTKTGIESNEARHALVFGDGEERKDLSLAPTGAWEMFSNFFRYGVRHFLIGYDHIAFLVALLLPSVLIAQNGQWVPVSGFKRAALNVATVVSLFTLAHSLTLSLAALKILRLPEAFVEALIALSIVFVAVRCFIPRNTRLVWLVVLGLGLLHGLGFASVLEPYGVEDATILPTLLAFNLGVEVGQLAVIAIVFPALYVMRQWAAYRWVVLYPGAMVLLAAGTFWFFRRAFDLDLSIMRVLRDVM